VDDGCGRLLVFDMMVFMDDEMDYLFDVFFDVVFGECIVDMCEWY